MKKTAPLLMLFLLLAACGGLPPEAETTAKSAAKALAAHDKDAFAKLVLPDQREGALGLDKGYPIEMGKPANELTLHEVLDAQFFTEIQSAEVSDDTHLDSESEGRVFISLDYGDSTFTSKTFVLKKKGDAWLIDFKETLELWRTIDGADALSVLKLQ